jgi:hypothetical protein
MNFDDFIKLSESFSNVKFFEKNHSYEIDGEKSIISVSGLISKYEKPFESQKIAKKVAIKEGVTVESILEKWEYNKEYSCHKGSEFHLYVENFLERRFCSIDKKSFINFIKSNNKNYSEDLLDDYYKEMAILIRNFKNFYEWWKQDHILLKSEFVIGDKQTKICGTIDNLSYNKKTKKLVIFDYKTNKKINKNNIYGETFLKPFSNIEKCEYMKYSLQLNLYQLIFERNSSFKIEDSYIVWVGGSEDYELIKCSNLKSEALSMLNNHSLV